MEMSVVNFKACYICLNKVCGAIEHKTFVNTAQYTRRY